MAGSRLEKFGTVFTRVRDLMRAGVIKHEHKPIWFDVYAAFPPKREPLFEKHLRKVRKQTEDSVPEIFYKEDEIRAKFFEVYGNGPRAFELLKSNFVSPCQRFVMKYSELESRGDVKPEALFEETAKALLAEGVLLRKRGGPAQMATESRDPLLNMKLTEMLADQQRDTETETDVSEKRPQEADSTDSQSSSKI
ncbi:28S ribosomal protein S23, mitochondrial isoform X1 [Triplophysa rosa]|uniref:Small ribosomal subunit protein mS23 n=1 Tax=Triplophysa rosa TaxID=992332 RepID=A0A9W7WGT3_TRIRA|nr:28S ribosomal protein S23, mitochondrial isoform X1 [Triplophysa rosa]KAI7801047.1 putative 28S ribosomal protein S23 [Triplophysa rosa]